MILLNTHTVLHTKIKDEDTSPYNFHYQILAKYIKNRHWRKTYSANGAGKIGFQGIYAE